MRSTLVKLVLGCGLAVALATPTLACEFYNHSVQTDQTVARAAGPRSGRDLDHGCAADRRIPTCAERQLELTICFGRSEEGLACGEPFFFRKSAERIGDNS